MQKKKKKKKKKKTAPWARGGGGGGKACCECRCRCRGSVAHSCSAPVKEGRLQPLHLHGVPLSPLRRGQPQLRTDLVRPVVQSIVHVDMSVSRNGNSIEPLGRLLLLYQPHLHKENYSTKSQHFTTSSTA